MSPQEYVGRYASATVMHDRTASAKGREGRHKQG